MKEGGRHTLVGIVSYGSVPCAQVHHHFTLLCQIHFFLRVVLTECSQQFPASEVGLTEPCQNMEEQNLFVPEVAFICSHPFVEHLFIKECKGWTFFWSSQLLLRSLVKDCSELSGNKGSHRERKVQFF